MLSRSFVVIAAQLVFAAFAIAFAPAAEAAYITFVAANGNDSNPCTDDRCDGAGGCAHTDNTMTCDDGNACTRGDRCAQPALAILRARHLGRWKRDRFRRLSSEARVGWPYPPRFRG